MDFRLNSPGWLMWTFARTPAGWRMWTLVSTHLYSTRNFARSRFGAEEFREVTDRRRGISRGPGSAPALLRIPGTSDVDSRGLPRTREGFPGWNRSELKSGRISVNFSPNGRWNSSGWHRPGMARQGGSLKRTIVLSQGIPTRDMQSMCKLLIRHLMDRFSDRPSAEEFREVADRRPKFRKSLRTP